MEAEFKRVCLALGGVGLLIGAGMFNLSGSRLKSSLTGHVLPEVKVNNGEVNSRYVDGKKLQGVSPHDYGDIYTAVDENSKNVVVLKFERKQFMGEQGPELGATATKELSTMKALQKCDFVARLLDDTVTDQEGIPVLVMPYYAGGDLAQYLASGEPSRRARAIQIYLPQIITALDCIHSVGYVLGDLKPANIFLSDDKEQALLGDFGLAAKASSGEFHQVDTWMLGALILEMVGFDVRKYSIPMFPPESSGRPIDEETVYREFKAFMESSGFKAQANCLTGVLQRTLRNAPAQRERMTLKKYQALGCCAEPIASGARPRASTITFGGQVFCAQTYEPVSSGTGGGAAKPPKSSKPSFLCCGRPTGKGDKD